VINRRNLDKERELVLAASPNPAADLDEVEANGRATLFVARNTTFRTDRIDLSPFATDVFDFISSRDVELSGSTRFEGFGGSLLITAAGTIRNRPQAKLEAATNQFFLVSLGGADFRGRETGDGGGLLQLREYSMSNRRGDAGIFAPRVELTDVTLESGRDTVISSVSSLAILTSSANSPSGFPSTSINASNKVSARGAVRITSGSNNRVEGLVAQGRQIEIAGGAVQLRAVQLQSPSGSTGGAISVNARENLEMNLASLRAPVVTLSGRTVILRNVDFQSGSVVTLKSALGLLAPRPNSNRPVLSGYVNFVTNVLYGGGDASEAITQGTGPGIRVERR
jgi:hypothetical protein